MASDLLLNGTLDTSLIDKSAFTPQIDDILKISREQVYQSDEVVQKEIAGYKILSTLLDVFTTAVENEHHGKTSHYDRLILKRLPEYAVNDSSLYNTVIDSCSYIAGMTDGKALMTFNTINGNNL